jgi:hypothetical protein
MGFRVSVGSRQLAGGRLQLVGKSGWQGWNNHGSFLIIKFPPQQISIRKPQNYFSKIHYF